MRVLVLNTGSSSIKYKLIDTESREALDSGLVESTSLDTVREKLSGLSPDAVGHRVVHGGPYFSEPALVDDAVLARIEECIPLAPLHNPSNLEGIRLARQLYPDVPQVAVFDTAFHATIPEHAYRYALPASVGPEVRKYGFHGTSHAYVSREAERLLGRPLRLVSLHLGNGASAAAIDRGRCIDTSMGMTPTAGLVMGTRTGDLDPGLLLHLLRQGHTPDSVDRLINRESGLSALAGTNDMRELTSRTDPAAALALDIYCHRIRHYIGAYAAALGGLDALVFTAGIGENSPAIRARVLTGLDFLGLHIDPTLNPSPARAPREISPPHVPTPVLVIPTNEELEIATQVEWITP